VLTVGCVTAREFRDYLKLDTIPTRTEGNSDAEDDEYNRNVRRDLVHGVATPVTTEMKRIRTWKIGREAIDRARV
jgi:hypothetical protein